MPALKNMGPQDSPWHYIPGYVGDRSDVPVAPPEAVAPEAIGSGPAAPAPGEDPMFDQYIASVMKGNEETQKLANELALKQGASIEAEKGRLADQEADAMAYAKMPFQKDLSPMAGMMDAWYGTNTAKQFEPKDTPESRMQMLQTLKAGVNKARGNLTDAELSLIRTRLNNAQMSDTNARKILEARMAKKDSKERTSERDALKFEKQEQEMRDKVMKYQPILDGATRFRSNVQVLRDFVAQNGLPKTGEQAQRYAQLFNRAKLDAKNAEELGAITNADVGLITGLLGPEGTFEKLLATGKGGSEGVVKALDQTLSQSDNAFKSKMRSLRVGNPTKAAQPVLKEFEDLYMGASSKGKKTPDGSPNAPVDDGIIIIE